ncbi:MAG: phenylalanine--tRNA ligase subunit alpha [Candidatus Omnitrophica bacterium]|nr:phenylalanine--tRNA ligase subunit alpha [Candidatus Omnitrophota bacterium]
MGSEDRLKRVEEEAIREIDATTSLDELETVKIKYLSRKGIVSQLFKDLPNIQEDEKPSFGKGINRLKELLNQELKQRSDKILSESGSELAEAVDITMPAPRRDIGVLHPITKTMKEICDVFSHMGFAVVEGPEIETEYNNFEALNIPVDHPSRDTFDTFYIKDKWLLRSHTSPVQIRYMQEHGPPFSIVVPGKVFRPDAVDASHSFMFHQVEGLMVSDNITFANLKWALFEFASACFGPASKVRFRPHFFPFTEPSAEVDVSCMICQGRGCRVCSQKGWLEILGAGMVDPNVFKAVGIDPDKYSGFAFGMGVERIAMLKYGIDDIRLFYENDLRFLNQF